VSFYNSAKGVKEHFWLEKVQTTERRDEHWWTVCNIIAGRKLEKEELDDHIQDWGKRHPEEVAAIKKPTEKSNLDIDREGL
jgi:outer membrane PBP1 activator LpoA protein